MSGARASRKERREKLSGRERSSFFGRQSEMAALRLALEEGAPLVTVVGTAGIGKTRLARRLAESLQGAYPGGVWFCSLTGARNAGELLAAVAGTLGVPLQGKKPEVGLADAMAGRGKMLLVLDGFEHLVEHAPGTLGLWLDRAHRAQILVTSIVRLGIVGESCFELSPLKPDEAVAMYQDRARAFRGDLDKSEVGPIADLVARLDHLPLAIELAASRAALLSPRQLLSRIDKCLELLRGKRYGRHDSLAGAIGCVFDLMSPVERAALGYCAAFRGGFTLEAAEAVVDLSGHRDAPPVLDVIASLREKSLLVRTGPTERLDMFESVRAFALQELTESQALETVQASHREYFLRLGEKLSSEIYGPRGAEAVKELAAERENLLAAQLSGKIVAADECARIGLALLALLGRQGPPALEIEVADRTVDAARRFREDDLLGEALWARAAAHIRQGNTPRARSDVDEGLRLARREGDRCLEGRLLVYSGRMRSFSGDLEKGREELFEAIGLQRDLGNQHLEGQALNVLGTVEENAGRLAESAEHFQNALALFRSAGDIRYQGSVLMNLGVVRSTEGRHEDARDLLLEAKELLEQAGDSATAADVMVNLGSVHINMGELGAAEQYLERALALERALGNRRFEGLALANLGLLAAERSNMRLARQRFHSCLQTFSAGGDRRFLSVTLPFAAAVDASLGLIGEARANFAEARRALEEMGDKGMLRTQEVLEGFLDLALAREAAERLELEESAHHVDDARKRLRLRPAGDVQSEDFPTALRLLKRALEDRDAGFVQKASVSSGPTPSLGPSEQALLVSESVDWFTPPGGERVDISRRGPLRLVLQGL
ncbi:MAG: ATP-binding protein, partial [Myxococcota bacterium]